MKCCGERQKRRNDRSARTPDPSPSHRTRDFPPCCGASSGSRHNDSGIRLGPRVSELMREVAGALERVLRALDDIGVRYMVGGSLASSIHGIQRSTRDIDIVASIEEHHSAALASDLGGDFYIDPESARDALRRGRPFNLIHFATSYKFDIFPIPDDPYYQMQLQRSELKEIAFGDQTIVASYVAS